jgi:hypothetical protein
MVADGLSPMKIWNQKSMNMEFPAPAVSIPSTKQKKRACRKDTNSSNWQRNEMFLTLG